MKPQQTKHNIYFKEMMGASTLDAEEKIATGYLAAFGNKDIQKEILVKGCCTKSIVERGPNSNTPRKIAFLAFHKMHLPVGRFKSLTETAAGLYYEAYMDNVPYVRDTIIPQMKSGTLNNHSIGYDYVFDKVEHDEAQDAYLIKEIELYEGSILTLGANELTPFTGFKDFMQKTDDYNDLAIRASVLLKRMPSYTDEIELRTIMKSYQSLLDSAAEEIKKLTVKGKKPTKFDYKYLSNNFKL